jgi:hypothetical protein
MARRRLIREAVAAPCSSRALVGEAEAFANLAWLALFARAASLGRYVGKFLLKVLTFL